MKSVLVFFEKEVKVGVGIIVFSLSLYVINYFCPGAWDALQNLFEDREIFESINWKAVR